MIANTYMYTYRCITEAQLLSSGSRARTDPLLCERRSVAFRAETIVEVLDWVR